MLVMARKLGITEETVAAAAVELAELEGLAGVTLGAVAERVGVRSPSLYAHVDGLHGLRALVALEAVRALTAALRAARGDAVGLDAFRAEARGYRRFGLEHPGLYEGLLVEPRPGLDRALQSALRTLTTATDRSLSEASIKWAERVHVSRLFRASLHGFVLLERERAFGSGSSLDESFERLVEQLVTSARTAATL